MSTATIPVSDTTLRLLREMAEWANVSVEAALEKAIQEQHERQFWTAVNAGYAALWADPQAWAEEEAERKLWDATVMDGLDPAEQWTPDGTVAPPTSQGEAS
jgi:predicted transcriptional regulator